jgi:hypothetical protein
MSTAVTIHTAFATHRREKDAPTARHTNTKENQQ